MKINDFYPRTGFGRVLWYGVWGPINLVLAFGPLLFFNFLQFPSLLLLPFSRRAFRAYNRAAAAMVWGWWAFASEKLIGLRIEFSGDEVGDEENAIVICNHQGMGDIPILLCLALRKGRIGDLKWVVKDILKYVPGLGWGMLFLECVFVKRSWAKDESKIVKAYAKFQREQIPLWMVMFPEGTRFKPEKMKKSREFARKHQLHPLTNVLIPRTKGFYTALIGLRAHVTSVYSMTIAYDGRVPSLVSVIRGDVKHVRCHVRKIAIKDLPIDQKGIEDWLMRDFQLKDQWLGTLRAEPALM